MNREEAKNLVIQTFENKFDKEKFIRFIANLFKKYDRSKALDPRIGVQGITEKYLDFISSWERIGRYEDSEGNIIDILIVKLKKEISLLRARSAQRNFVADYLRGKLGTTSLKDAALVAFVSPNEEDWRFSLVKMDYKFEETETRRVKIKEEFTPAKRWSFLVGPNEKSHTAQSRFIPLLEKKEPPLLLELEEAFNIEVVTEEFFRKYRDLFIKTKIELDKVVQKDKRVKDEFQRKNITTIDFAKKLLGQIVFLYFLQKKGWFGVERGKPWGTGPKDFIRKLFNKEYGDYQNFYNDILEPLLYEALRTDRSADDHYYSRFNCKIPFLNGGLFDPPNNFDWVNIDLLLPNELFSNSNKTPEGDVGDGILDIFDRYNFTVNEEEPLEKEVALDPELLGKIYEKLNAIREDNFDEYIQVLKSGKKGDETKFNKDYGVYYTPRVIVHYMCQESLISYLETELNGKVKREDIERFVNLADNFLEHEKIAVQKNEKIKNGEQKETKYEHKIPKSIIENAKEIDNLLANIKVCDPAVGSGAFLVGMLHEIVKLRQLLSVYLGNEVSIYDLKRQTIENSLYGVDIDPGAVEICKLRLWLSLVVDEDDFYNIKPLPNLDYKVVKGNSLVGFPENWKSDISERIDELENKLFSETHPGRKKQIKEELDALILKRLKNSEKNFGYKIDFDFRLFFPRVFKDKGGFDIVIGNPPYVKEYTNRKAFDGLRNSPYYQGKMDIWYLFACKGIDFLKNKGVLTFIAQNNWITSYGASKMRNKVVKECKILQLLDFGPYFIFGSSDIQTMIMIFQKSLDPKEYSFDLRRIIGKKPVYKDVIDLLNKIPNPNNEYLNPTINRNKFLNKPLTFSKTDVEAVLKKIEEKGKERLHENEITNGIHSHHDKVSRDMLKKLGQGFKVGDGIFVLSDEEKNNLQLTEKELELIKPYYTSKELKKYYAKRKNSEWIIYTDSRFKDPEAIKPYPNIKKHLDKFQAVITSDNKPYGLHRARDERFFKGEKIIALRKCVEPTFTYTDFDCYVSAAFYVIKTNRFNMKYLTGLLNSKLIAFWLRHKGKMQGNNYQIDKEPLLNIPIPPLTPQNQPIADQIINLVDHILSIKQQDPDADTSNLEKEIDQLVYELYNLTDEEIKIVEGV